MLSIASMKCNFFCSVGANCNFLCGELEIWDPEGFTPDQGVNY